jgi:hypothetical protein
MRPRTAPLPVREGWPFFQVEAGGLSFVLRIRGGPSERAQLRDWFATTSADAWIALRGVLDQIAAVTPETTSDEAFALKAEAGRLSAEANGVAEGTAGWLIAWAWHDPAMALDAREGWERGDFKGATGMLDCGRAAVAELLDAGLAWEDVQDIASTIAAYLAHGRPNGQRAAEIRPFGVTATSPTP